MVNVSINGNSQHIDADSTVQDFLLSRSVDPTHVVVELNGVILERDLYAGTKLKSGDAVEILRFVGGG